MKRFVILFAVVMVLGSVTLLFSLYPVPKFPSTGEMPNLSQGTGASVQGSLLDLNTVTAVDLAKVPGVGPTTAIEIIRARADHEAGLSRDDLNELGITQEELASWSPYIAVPVLPVINSGESSTSSQIAGNPPISSVHPDANTLDADRGEAALQTLQKIAIDAHNVKGLSDENLAVVMDATADALAIIGDNPQGWKAMIEVVMVDLLSRLDDGGKNLLQPAVGAVFKISVTSATDTP